MNPLMLGLVLALIPVFNFILKYYSSIKNKNLKLFRQHFITYRVDWIFVPFNFLWVYTFYTNYKFLWIFALLSLVIFGILGLYWMKLHKNIQKPVYMFDIKTGKIYFAGFVEILFFVFELALILSLIFSNVLNIFVLMEITLLLIFLLLVIPSSIKMHGRLIFGDALFIAIGLIILIIKLFSLYL